MTAETATATVERATREDLLAAVLELARYQTESEIRAALSNPQDVYDYLRDMTAETTERLVVLTLDSRNRVIRKRVVSVGTLNTTRTMPREIFRGAIVDGALAVILAHNHPSGDPEPSAEDIGFTRAVLDAGNVVGIEVYDHVVVARDGYVSLRERGVVRPRLVHVQPGATIDVS